ncbi:hypothetical protein DWB61_13135 [Ancylomarina euxinus]|uniref:Chromosome segregation protein SMC n=1 Tax=Ancylomarina euxinus TaxID=2283627 RepID=A0A425XYT9_9BACT|nr:hypothetical protein [Ancylomarina euxinus]MCZ4695653.1 hypothetical protein [Ancylomarina euxinus]MUP16043.1 hypothetical protein [Ancylomarina euxinus]RRG20287.1 hypothetical protein DWB61_13135 [Ancylomarina euxinus]
MSTDLKTEKKDQIYKIVLISLGVILLTVSILFLKTYRENRQYIAEIKIEKADLETELRDLSQDYDSLQTSNDTLNQLLVTEKGKIDELLERMRVFRNNSYFEINKYKKEIGTLKGVLRSYVVQIDSLNSKNKELNAENIRVKKQISYVKERNEKLESTTKNMEELISKASALDATNIECSPINKKGKFIKKISKTEKLKASFTLRKNITIKPGLKTIYVRIVRPDEVVLSNPEGLLFEYENTQMAFSAKRDIEFEGNELEVSIFWDNDGSLIQGEYTLDLFSEGVHIGNSSFTLK